MTIDFDKLISNIAKLGASYARQQKRARAPATQACSYCGAPGQRVSTRCEHCQVFVSREARR